MLRIGPGKWWILRSGSPASDEFFGNSLRGRTDRDFEDEDGAVGSGVGQCEVPLTLAGELMT